MQRLSGARASEFLEIDVTMPQAKVLYLLAAAGELRMSDLVAQLGVSLSTVSGLVDKVVDHGLAARHDDPTDRRHVVVSLTPAGRAILDQFHELNASQLRDLLRLLDDDGLSCVNAAVAALSRAADRFVAGSGVATTPSIHPGADATRPSSPPIDRKDPA